MNRNDILELERYVAELEKRKAKRPIDFYNKGNKVHEKQLVFHKDTHKNRWSFGGNRTGKTVTGAVEAIWYATGTHPYKNIKPSDGWVVSLSNEVQRDVSQKEILKWLPREWIESVVMRQGRQDDLENGTIDFIQLTKAAGGCKMGFKSCDQGREKFQGTKKGWVWFDEEPLKPIYDECKMRVMDSDGDIWGTMTPLKGLTWVYDIIWLNYAMDAEVKAFTMSWEDNPWLTRKVIDALIQALPASEREARQHGKFMAGSQLIYGEFDEDIHVIDPFEVPVEWYDNLSIDTGFNNPLSCHFYACDPEGNIYVIAEHYEAKRLVPYHSEVIKRMADDMKWERGYGNMLNSIMDSASDQHTLAAEKSVFELFRDHGIIGQFVDKSVVIGIQRVKRYFQLLPSESDAYPNGKPKIFIFRTCVHMIKELKSYRWAEQKEGLNDPEKPIKYNDHSMDELRYYIMSKPQAYEEVHLGPSGFYAWNELVMLGYRDREIRQLVLSGRVTLIGRKGRH